MLKELLKKINESEYWDACVYSLDCNYFGDEVKLVFENGNREEGTTTYFFEECYTIKMKHFVDYDKDKPYKELSKAQIPYYMQNVEVKEIINDEKQLLEFTINMFPMNLHIVCKKFSILQFGYLVNCNMN